MKKILLLLLLFLSLSLFAQNNPLASGSSAPGAAEQAVGGGSGPSAIQGRLAIWQQKIRSRLETELESSGPVALFTLCLFSFLYGIVHALGPGHRKVVLFSWFVNKRATALKAVLAGLLSGLVYGGSAIFIFSSLYYVFNAFTVGRVGLIENHLTNITFWALLFFGIYMLIHSVGEWRSHHEEPSEESDRSLFLILISSLIPCPGAGLILTFSLGYGFFSAGVAAVAFMSLGMGLTLSLFSLGGFLVHRGVLHISLGHGDAGWVLNLVEIAGALLIVLFSLIMIL